MNVFVWGGGKEEGRILRGDWVQSVHPNQVIVGQVY